MNSHKIVQPSIREDGLQLEEHREFQERLWTVQRAAWLLFGVLLLIALAGLTGGGGMLSHSTVQLQAGTIDYPRLSRWEATDELTATFATAGDEHRLSLSKPFSTFYQIEDIQPEPEQSLTTPNGQLLVFKATDGGRGEVMLHLRALRPGFAEYEVGMDGGKTTEITTFILP